jgi:hypothetical protein
MPEIRKQPQMGSEIHVGTISTDEIIVRLKAQRGRKKGQYSNPFNAYIAQHYEEITAETGLVFKFSSEEQAKKKRGGMEGFILARYPDLRATADGREVIVSKKQILIDEGLLKDRVKKIQAQNATEEIMKAAHKAEADADRES